MTEYEKEKFIRKHWSLLSKETQKMLEEMGFGKEAKN
jgi:hypothetical protein